MSSFSHASADSPGASGITPAGQKQFSDLTARISSGDGCPSDGNPDCQLAMVVDGVVLASPTIDARIPGRAQITGNFTEQSARILASVLASGSLPSPVTATVTR